MKKITYFYEKLVKILFFIYLAGMLSLGRAFAIIQIVKIGPVPIFVTELLLLIAAPLVLLRIKNIFELPTRFLTILAIFFLFGTAYLAAGAISGNFYSLRDIVFCGYILFLPITLIVFPKKKDMTRFLGILFICNLIGLALGRLWVFKATNLLLPMHFSHNIRTFNLGLYYGITVSFMIAFFRFLTKKWHKLLVLLLVALNIYILTFFKVRAISVGGIALTIFFLLVSWKNISWRSISKIVVWAIPGIVIIFIILGYYDSGSPIRLSNKYISTKGGVKTLIEQTISPDTSTEEFPGNFSADIFSPEIPVHKLPSRRFKSRTNLVWRLDLWYQAIHFGLKSPFFGRGFGVYPRYVVWFLVKALPAKGIGSWSETIPAHNHLISVFYRMGLFGLGLFLFINGYVFFYGLEYIKKCKADFVRCFLIGSLGAFVFWHASALFFDIINSPPTSIFLWIILGLIFAIVKVDRGSYEYQPEIKSKSPDKSKAPTICGIKVNIIQIPAVIEKMQGWIKSRDFGNCIAVSNSLDVILGRKDRRIRDSVNSSSLSVPDGISLVLAAKAYGYDLRKRVYGPDLLIEFLKSSEDKKYSHFFYGTTSQTLKRLVANLKKQFPKLKVSGTCPSFFREMTAEEDDKLVEVINNSRTDVLWVGIGCPRQALWMQEHKDKLKVPVMVGVGAAFDFLSGTKPQAPRWLRDSGFEWLFRLITEPKRLWKRYLIGNLIFLWLFLKEFTKRKILKKGIEEE